MTERWKHINDKIPFGKCSLFFDSQRRFFAEGAYRDTHFAQIISSTFFFLFHYKTGADQNKLLFYYGWLRDKANAGQMMDKIAGGRISQEFTVWYDDEIFRVTGKNILFPFTRRFFEFIKISAGFLFCYLRHNSVLRLNAVQFFTYFLHKSALAAYLKDAIRKCNVQAFVTYNDYLNKAADIAFAFRSCARNVYHIQHGVLSETNYPGLASHFLLWGAASREKAISLGYRPEILYTLGAACFEARIQEATTGKTFLFFSQTNLPHASGEQYCSMARQWIKEAALQLKDWKFIIRLHPDEDTGIYYKDLQDIPNIEIQMAGSCPVSAAVGRASVCATIWSGAGIDAMILQKVLLVLTPADFQQKTDWARNGCTEITSSSQLTEFLKTITDEKMKQILNNQNIALQKEIENPDASADIAEFIILQQRKRESL